MTTLSTSDSATSPSAASNPSSSSAMQLVRSGGESQSWPVPMGRCTLGSSQQCQVQLTGDQVRPLHCLIVRDEEKTIVTRWAPGVLLNGEEFSTATLKPDDQLTICGIELQLQVDLEQSSPVEQQQLATCPQAVTAPPAAKPIGRASRSESSRGERDRKVRRLWLANFNARSRCRQLIESMRELRNQSAGSDQQIGVLHRQLQIALEERQQMASELEQRRAELTENEQRATAQIDQLTDELSKNCERANTSELAVVEQALASEKLRDEIDTLACQREQLEQAQAQLKQEQQLLSKELADRNQAMEQQQHRLDQSEEASRANAEQVAQLTHQLETLQEELDQKRIERESLAVEQNKLGDRQRELE